MKIASESDQDYVSTAAHHHRFILVTLLVWLVSPLSNFIIISLIVFTCVFVTGFKHQQNSPAVVGSCGVLESFLVSDLNLCLVM